MNKRTKSVLIILILLTSGGLAWSQDISSIIPVSLQGLEKGTWRFELENDLLFGNDNGFTSGWSLQKHSPVAEHWSKLEGVPDFIGRWGARIPTLSVDGLRNRAGVAIGQIMQSPQIFPAQTSLRVMFLMQGH